MVVYVDEMRDWAEMSRRKSLRYTRWCHMLADTRHELHSFAGQLGLQTRWFQDHPYRWHYDLTPGRRSQAVRMGAREVTFRDVAALMYLRRHKGNARQVTEDSVVEVYTWHGECLFLHAEDDNGKKRITGLLIPVDGEMVPARYGDWVVKSEDGDCAVHIIGHQDPSRLVKPGKETT